MKNIRQSFVGKLWIARLYGQVAVALTCASIGLSAGAALAASTDVRAKAPTPAAKKVSKPQAKVAAKTSSASRSPLKSSYSHAVTTQDKKRAAASLMSPPMQASLDERPPAAAPAVETNKTRSKRFLKEGARLHRIGEYADAERLFKQAVAMDPRNPDAFFNLGALAEGRGDLVDALTQYRAGLALMPHDKSLKDAVESMETRLASGANQHNEPDSFGDSAGYGSDRARADISRWSGNFRYPPTMFGNPNPTAEFSEPPVLGVSAPDPPLLSQSSDPAPVMPVGTNGPFQLSSTQNAALANGGRMGNIGTYNVMNSNPAPTLSVSQPSRSGGRRVAGATFNAALRVGVRAALSGTGLHCPACHFLRF